MSLRKYVATLEEIREALCVFVVVGGHSFSIVEEERFKNLMRCIAPDFDLISRYTIKRDAMIRYKVEKNVVAIDLMNAPGRISFTTDNWRSENTADEFVCVMSHWIDTDWNLHKRIIKFAALNPPFNGV